MDRSKIELVKITLSKETRDFHFKPDFRSNEPIGRCQIKKSSTNMSDRIVCSQLSVPTRDCDHADIINRPN